MFRHVLAAAVAPLLLAAPSTGVAQPPAPAQEQSIDRVYDKMCRNCHGSDGKAETKMGRKHEIGSFADVTWQKNHSDQEILAVILDGVPDTKMKAYRTKLTKAQADELVAWVRGFDPRRSPAAAGTPPAPAAVGQPPAPAKSGGATVQPPAPAKSGGATVQPPAPAKSGGATSQPPAPAKSGGATSQPPAPAKSGGTASQPPAPARN